MYKYISKFSLKIVHSGIKMIYCLWPVIAVWLLLFILDDKCHLVSVKKETKNKHEILSIKKHAAKESNLKTF